MKTTEGLYWVAIRGPAMPSWPLPVTEAEMRRAIVRVGTMGAQTMWVFHDGDHLVDMASDYEYLIGYRTPEQQRAGQTILLSGTIAAARAEVWRAMQQETVIRGVTPGDANPV